MSSEIRHQSSSKNRKQPKIRRSEKYDVVSLMPEAPVTLSTFGEVVDYNSVQVLIKQTRRCNYIVFLAQFISYVRIALQSGKFIIDENKYSFHQKAGIKLLKKKTGDLTIHTNKWRLLVLMDLSYGPLPSQIKCRQSVDILGAQINVNGDLAINLDPEVLVWTERTIQLHIKSHYPCINRKCYMTFDVKLHYDHCFECPVCKIQQCPQCQVDWEIHKGLTCNQCKIKREISEVADRQIMDSLYSGDIQPCPKCNALTLKMEGCGKIICGVLDCNELWCWYCGKGSLATDPINRGDPYNHWYKKICPVFTGIFSDDAKSQSIIKNAISVRNLSIFGNKIKPITNDEIKTPEIIIKKTKEQKNNDFWISYPTDDLSDPELDGTELDAPALNKPYKS